MSEADLGDELLEPEPTVGRGARTAGVLVDHHDRRSRPAEIDRALPQRILALRGLGVALDLHERRLTHIHDRATLAVALGDLLVTTHRAPPPPARRSTARAARHRDLALGRQRLPHRRRHHPFLRGHLQRELPDIATSVFNGDSASRRTPTLPQTAQPLAKQPPRRRRRHHAQRRLRGNPQRQIRPTRRQSRCCRPPSDR